MSRGTEVFNELYQKKQEEFEKKHGEFAAKVNEMYNYVLDLLKSPSVFNTSNDLYLLKTWTGEIKIGCENEKKDIPEYYYKRGKNKRCFDDSDRYDVCYSDTYYGVVHLGYLARGGYTGIKFDDRVMKEVEKRLNKDGFKTSLRFGFLPFLGSKLVVKVE